MWPSPAYELSPQNSSGHHCEDDGQTRGQHALETTNKKRFWLHGGVPHQTAPGFCLWSLPLLPTPLGPHSWERLASAGEDVRKARAPRMPPWETGRRGTNRILWKAAPQNPGTAEGWCPRPWEERVGRRGRGSSGESGNAADTLRPGPPGEQGRSSLHVPWGRWGKITRGWALAPRNQAWVAGAFSLLRLARVDVSSGDGGRCRGEAAEGGGGPGAQTSRPRWGECGVGDCEGA